ncbi:nucleoside-triphosphatase [Bacillus sp. FJAT-28004]|uniref:nucleoside-triphosphatase n=1 Tax=Bacillus sp. FJAT-28004 TaxID=1679165 RepID=UPI0006B431D9|nr:nucleoside-triphosphatase [Bacillus sp. FJAT-28004]
MDTNFLLTGKPRVGKSTAIIQLINRIGIEHFGGIYTEEVRNETNRIGFNCVTLRGESKRIASVDSQSSVRIGRYGVDIEAFENIALTAIRQSLNTKKITVIDEIGFLQMLSVPFQKMIQDIVSNSQHILLGTICVDSHPVINKIKELPGIKLYAMDVENRELTIEALASDLFRLL